jgi:N utilization substance protein B
VHIAIKNKLHIALKGKRNAQISLMRNTTCTESGLEAMTRRESRKHLFCLLFQRDFYPPEEFETQCNVYFEEKNIEEPSDKTYLTDKVSALLARLDEIDGWIEQYSKGWKLDRIGKAELAILRIGVYEAKCDDDIPVGVAINEAVELTKKYGGEQAPAFINGILGKIVNDDES